MKKKIALTVTFCSKQCHLIAVNARNWKGLLYLLYFIWNLNQIQQILMKYNIFTT